MTFGVIAQGSNDEKDIKRLLVMPEIWDGQRRDEDDVEKVECATFENTIAAVFRREGVAFGYVLFVHKGDGLFIQHTAFIESERGKVAIECIEAALKAMFLETMATDILTHCPEWALGTAKLARTIGAHCMFRMPNFAVRDGRMQYAAVYGLTMFEWAWLHHADFEEQGEKWHEQVFGDEGPSHDHDPVHEMFLGLALEMGIHQPHKAVFLYNGWARRAGYAEASLLWAGERGHSLVDFRDGIALNGPNGVISVIPRCPQKAELFH